MPKNKKKQENWWFWLVIGLVASLMIAPNTTVIRVLVGQIQPLEFTLLRSALIVIVSMPFVLISIRKFNRRNLVFTLGAGVSMTIATISLVYAVKYSGASYAAIMGLVSPILLVILSSRFMGDKISPRAVAGVALAAAGAFIVVALPLAASGQSSTHFYPLATTLMLINSLFFTLGTLFSRKSNEAGMPLMANSGLMSVIIATVSFACMYAVEGLPTDIGHFSINTWVGIFYSGVVVVYLARVMSIASFERVGAAATSGLSYLGTIISVLIPIIVLGEKLSSTIISGGAVILVGVYLTEKHRAKHQHHKYMHAH